jgi:hypothetical protein
MISGIEEVVTAVSHEEPWTRNGADKLRHGM